MDKKKWPKYSVIVDRERSKLGIERGGTIVVKGRVCHGEVVDVQASGGTVEGYRTRLDQPVTERPVMKCEVSDGLGAQIAAVDFRPDKRGAFSLRISASRYKIGTYGLCFHLPEECPDELIRSITPCYIFGKKEIAAVRKLFREP